MEEEGGSLYVADVQGQIDRYGVRFREVTQLQARKAHNFGSADSGVGREAALVYEEERAHEFGPAADSTLAFQHAQSAHDHANWMPDEDSEVCLKCGAGFGLLWRRHHCRRCGLLFCSACTPGTRFLPHLCYPADERQRVCEYCFRQVPGDREADPGGWPRDMGDDFGPSGEELDHQSVSWWFSLMDGIIDTSGLGDLEDDAVEAEDERARAKAERKAARVAEEEAKRALVIGRGEEESAADRSGGASRDGTRAPAASSSLLPPLKTASAVKQGTPSRGFENLDMPT